MFSSANELVIPMKRLNLVGIFLGAVAFVALGIILVMVETRHGLFGRFMGLVTVTFFGAVAVSVLYRMLKPAPAVIIDSRGIVDNSSGTSVGFIAWDEIAEVREYQFQNQTFLGIMPKDLDRVLSRQPKWKRAAIRANLGLGAAPINIPQIVLGVKVSDLVREIEARFRRGEVL